MFEYIDRLGFGKKTGIDLNGEASGIIFNLDKVGPVEQATTSFGQGVSVTAIQQVAAVGGIVNGGNMYTPYIVSSISEPDTGITIEEFQPKLKSEGVVSKETSELVKYVLESVVANGSGHNAYIEGYRIGGKTGTAQKVGPDGRYMVGNYILSFIGFMPADDPELVIYIAIDGAHGVTQYGGTVSAPIASNVLKSAINLYNIKSDPEGIPKQYEWYETKYFTVPDVINMSKADALKQLAGFTIEYSGNGETVVETSPKAGERIKEGGVVKLMLN